MRIRLLIFCLTALAATASSAQEIDIGNSKIELPAPAGFTQLTPAMSPYYETMKAYETDQSVRHATFIRAEDAEKLLAGELPDLYRYVNVETPSNVLNIDISDELFDELKTVLRTQNQELFKLAEAQIAEALESGDKAVSEEFDVDLAMSVTNMMMMPIHYESKDALAFSMFINYSVEVDDVGAEEDVTAATVVSARVGGKLLNLNIYGKKTDLEWTQVLGAAYLDRILAANSP